MMPMLKVVVPIGSKYAGAVSNNATRALAGRAIDRMLHHGMVGEKAEGGTTEQIQKKREPTSRNGEGLPRQAVDWL